MHFSAKGHNRKLHIDIHIYNLYPIYRNVGGFRSLFCSMWWTKLATRQLKCTLKF